MSMGACLCDNPMRHSILILLLTVCACTSSTEDGPPNIILIMADDLGYGDLGSYGQTVIQTPRLDQMAAEGMRFTEHYAGSTVCAPSRCVVMTGLHTGHCRIRGNRLVPLEEDDLTIAELLQEADYSTALIGKWGLGEPGTTGIPNNQGFDYFYGYLNQVHAHNFYPEFLWRDTVQVPLRNEVVAVSRNGLGGYATTRLDYSHDLITEEALSWMEAQRSSPFFLFLAYTIPHANNEAPAGGLHGMEVPDYGIYADSAWEDPHKGTAAMISRLDRDVGRVLDQLHAQGVADNTLVLFTSDNGPHREAGRVPEFFNSSGALRGIKRDLYEGGIRVPFIAWWPGKIAPGQTTGHPSAFWDFLATASEAAGIDPAESDGISFLPTLLGQPQRQHQYLYWEFHEGPPKQAIRAGRWKAVYFHGRNAAELYDLHEDSGESNDLAAAMPELTDSLVTLIRQARTPSSEWPLDW